jgi:hypothetical protein
MVVKMAYIANIQGGLDVTIKATGFALIYKREVTVLYKIVAPYINLNLDDDALQKGFQALEAVNAVARFATVVVKGVSDMCIESYLYKTPALSNEIDHDKSTNELLEGHCYLSTNATLDEYS